MATVEEIQARREARRKALTDAKARQFAIDLAALDELEERHGYERVERINLPAWDPQIGGPTMVVARVPKSGEAIMKAFEADMSKAGDNAERRMKAQNTLGRACMAYPDPSTDAEGFKAALDTAPGIIAHVALVVVRRAQGIATEEGKG